jgi:hypothetical protein
VCFSILALLAFARVRLREAAIPLSIALAAAAVLTKVYFVFTLAAVVGLWLIELWIRPLMAGETGHKRHLTVLALTLFAAAALFAVFIYAFGHHLQAYYAVNSSKIPYLDPLQLASNFGDSFRALPGNTKTQAFLLVLVASGGLAVALSGLPRGRRFLRSNAAGLTRADLAAGLWLVLGLLVIGLLQPPKPHYHLFAIPPLCLAAAAGLKLVLPARLDIAAICAMAIANLVYQALYYQVWMQRPGKASLHNASREVVRIIHQDSGQSMIPVLGEYSAQLGLFSERVFSLDAKWSPDYALCERVAHWTPAYHVNIVWPGSVSRTELETVAGCRQVAKTEEIARFGIRPPSRDELVLSRVHYRD